MYTTLLPEWYSHLVFWWLACLTEPRGIWLSPEVSDLSPVASVLSPRGIWLNPEVSDWAQRYLTEPRGIWLSPEVSDLSPEVSDWVQRYLTEPRGIWSEPIWPEPEVSDLSPSDLSPEVSDLSPEVSDLSPVLSDLSPEVAEPRGIWAQRYLIWAQRYLSPKVSDLSPEVSDSNADQAEMFSSVYALTLETLHTSRICEMSKHCSFNEVVWTFSDNSARFAYSQGLVRFSVCVIVCMCLWVRMLQSFAQGISLRTKM